MVRGPSAYFVFCAEKRAEARAHVEAATEPGSKVSVATVAKRLGQLWQGLPDEKKQRYKELAKEKAQALPADQPAAAEATPGTAASGRTDAGSSEPSQAAAGCAGAEGVGAANLEEAQEADEAADGPADGAAEDALKATAAPQHFPISVVRKIMSLDEDVQRISSGAARATSRAAELFIQSLAVKALQVARKAKRKNLRFIDIEQVVRSDRRCVDMCLREILSSEATFAQARGELREADDEEAGEKENKGAQTAQAKVKRAKTKAPPTDLANVRQISSFFSH